MNVEQTPEADSAAVGSCNQFTTTVTQQGGQNAGQPVANQVVDVRVSGFQAAQQNQPAGTFGFCNPTTGAQQTGTATTPAGGSAHAEFTTNQQGQVTFGVFSTQPGTFQVQSFVEENNDNEICDAGDTCDEPSNKRFIGGGPNAVQDLNCVPPFDVNPEGSSHTFTCTATATAPAGGGFQQETVPISGVTVAFDVLPPDCTAGTNAATCEGNAQTGQGNNANPTNESPNADEVTNQQCTGATDQQGQVTCSYADPVTAASPIGVDNIRAFVNQQQQGATTGAFQGTGCQGGEPAFNPDANEPAQGGEQCEPYDDTQKQWTAAPRGLTLDLVCTGSAGPTTPQSQGAQGQCFNPITDDTEQFTAQVTNPQGNTAGPQSDIRIDFVITATGASATDNDAHIEESGGTEAARGTRYECFIAGPLAPGAAANTTCVATVHNPNPQSSDQVTLTATIAGQQGAGSSDTATKTWGFDARQVDCEPENAFNPPGSQHTILCRVTDRLGAPVPNQQITATEEGPGRFSSETVRSTNAQGEVTFTTTTAGTESGTQTITATITGQPTIQDINPNQAGNQPGTECQRAANQPAQGDRAGICADAVTKFWGTSPPVTTPPPGGWPRDLTLEASKRVKRFGRQFSLGGTISSTNPNTPNTCIAGVTVILDRQVVGTNTFVEVDRTTTDADGNFGFTRTADRSALYVARVDETGTAPNNCAQASSDPERVNVRKAVVLKPSDTRIRRGQTVRLRVIVRPCGGHAGDPVTLWKAIDGVFAKVGGKRSNDNCIANFFRKIGQDAVFQGRSPKSDADHLKGKSPAVGIRVRGGRR